MLLGLSGALGQATLTASFRQHIRLDCPVQRVERDEHGVVIHSATGSERFDKVVFACHSNQALQLLASPSRAEQEILQALPYATLCIRCQREAEKQGWNPGAPVDFSRVIDGDPMDFDTPIGDFELDVT